MPSPKLSRRRLLAAGATGATAALAGCGSVGASVSFSTWTPAEGTWPLARYDPANTAHNPNATPPRDDVETARHAELDVEARGVLATGDYVAAYGSRGATLRRRATWDREWRTALPSRAAGVSPPDEYGGRTLFLAGQAGIAPFEVRKGLVQGWRLAGDHPDSAFWTTYDRAGWPEALLPTADAVYVGSRASNEVVAFGRDDAGIRWRRAGIYPGLAADRLYAADRGTLGAYGARGTLDSLLEDGPATRWTTDVFPLETPPVLHDAGVFVGGQYGGRGASPSLGGYDAETGERLWNPLELGAVVRSPAVVDGVGYVGVATEGFDGGKLVAVNLDDGTVLWERDTDWWHYSAVAGGNGTVIARGAIRSDQPGGETTDAPGTVRAYDAESGEELWTFTTPDAPADGVALVGDAVYVGTRAGALHELRAP